MIIDIVGAYVGEVIYVRHHSSGTSIWLAYIKLGDDTPLVQIVFGGDRRLARGELVPVAPPGSWAKVLGPGMRVRWKKMRARRYRGERSHGMLCSLDELGWLRGGPNEVPALRGVKPGERLDDLPSSRWAEVVVDWERAKSMEAAARRVAARRMTARTYEHLRTRSRPSYQLAAGSHQAPRCLVVN